ncbi:MAG: tetraacyldisaccharide 4'-kinase, partial [Perlucidibaca sp.]
RDIEIAVIDGQRGLGSGLPLQAGPMREPASRLGSVDFRVVNGDWRAAGQPPADTVSMTLTPGVWQAVGTTAQDTVAPAAGLVHAVAGIGHPPRFFALLERLGYEPVPHAFPDHHAYQPGDLDFSPPLPVVMTEKDAVKCASLAPANTWFVPVQAMLPESFWHALLARLAIWRSTHA